MRKVFLDTSPLIYLLEGEPALRARVSGQLAAWVQSGVWLESSVLTLAELLVGPGKAGDVRLARRYRAAVHELLGTPLLAVDEAVAVYGAELRAHLGLRLPDALQLSAAVLAGCDVFYTNDARLRPVGGLEIVLVGADPGAEA
jgi:predicted nucleic acid-binding protein